MKWVCLLLTVRREIYFCVTLSFLHVTDPCFSLQTWPYMCAKFMTNPVSPLAWEIWCSGTTSVWPWLPAFCSVEDLDHGWQTFMCVISKTPPPPHCINLNPPALLVPHIHTHKLLISVHICLTTHSWQGRTQLNTHFWTQMPWPHPCLCFSCTFCHYLSHVTTHSWVILYQVISSPGITDVVWLKWLACLWTCLGD